MSEYQYVMFQAVDRPLNDNQLKYAQRQSTRADVSRWSLSVEYHYSSFRGDVDGLLRRGYDAYLQHTNYGDREIKLRLPHGMPVAKRVWSQYVDGEKLGWKKDAKGSGGLPLKYTDHPRRRSFAAGTRLLRGDSRSTLDNLVSGTSNRPDEAPCHGKQNRRNQIVCALAKHRNAKPSSQCRTSKECMRLFSCVAPTLWRMGKIQFEWYVNLTWSVRFVSSSTGTFL